jgi:hypothetical protein
MYVLFLFDECCEISAQRCTQCLVRNILTACLLLWEVGLMRSWKPGKPDYIDALEITQAVT